MRVGFAGTPDFAAIILDALVVAGFEVPLVLTQPDRRQGRGLKEQPSPVKRLAAKHAIAVLQPATLAAPDARGPVIDIPVNVLVVAAYGLLLPAAVLQWPRLGCINVHASLLPRWRGAAPIQRALMHGDTETGITLMQIDRGLDTGPMLDRVRVPIAVRETAGTLHDKLAHVGAEAIVALLQRIARGDQLGARPQPEDGITYAAKIGNADAAIDWSDSAVAIDRQVRALNPSPGAIAALGGKVVKLWIAQPAKRPAAGVPGTVLAADPQGIVVACGEGALALLEVQPAGGKSMTATAFVAGRRVKPGDRFD